MRACAGVGRPSGLPSPSFSLAAKGVVACLGGDRVKAARSAPEGLGLDVLEQDTLSDAG